METTEILLLLLNIAAFAALFGILYVVISLARTTHKVDRLVDGLNSLRPDLEKTIQELQGGLAEFKKSAEQVTAIAEDFKEISGATRNLAVPALEKVNQWKQHIQQVFSSAKSMFSRSHESKNGFSKVPNSQRKESSHESRNA